MVRLCIVHVFVSIMTSYYAANLILFYSFPANLVIFDEISVLFTKHKSISEETNIILDRMF